MFKPIIDVGTMFDHLTWKVWFGQATQEHVLSEVSSVSCKNKLPIPSNAWINKD